ncbi:hypothetical protein B0H19DRAFT_1266736 [Mycena capillaripes]|nr:hypothetical protein B0H19DRAFT_1266736 [Mycena capillaripes]
MSKPSQADSTKAPRQRRAPQHLLNGSNSEAPNAAHQAIVEEHKRVLMLVTGVIANLVKKIEDLSAVLPANVAEGTEDDEIHRVLTTVHGPDEGGAWSTFNRRFDILFKEDRQCRDKHGRLHLIRRGELGMLMVARYLRDMKWSAVNMNLEAATIKLERLIAELEFLCGMDASAAAKRAAATRKSASVSKQNAKSVKPKAGAASKSAAKDSSADKMIDAILTGRRSKPDNEYRPCKTRADLSEEEEDDFVDVVADAAAPPTGPQKRKIIAVDGVISEPPKKKKTKKAKPSTPSAAPTVEIIEVDDESDDDLPQSGNSGKRGPKSQSRQHFFPPVATTVNGDRRWSFKCRHCKT